MKVYIKTSFTISNILIEGGGGGGDLHKPLTPLSPYISLS